MNERIQALLKQATECYSNGQERSFDKEKFAKLIIKECAEVASDWDGAHYVGTAIRKHFGVEE